MAGIERTCPTEGCPFPLAEHYNWCGHQRPVTHLHWPKKGIGGNNPKSKIVALACWPCHDKIDNFGGNIITKDLPGKGPTTWGTDVRGNELFEKRLGEAESAAEEISSSSMVERRVGNSKVAADTGASHPVDVGSGPTLFSSSAAPPASPLSPAAEAISEAPLGVPNKSSAAEPSLALPGTITPTSLTLPQNLSLEGWARVGETLGNIHRASRFWIGDWLTFGEDTYHEKVAQSMDVTGLEFETLANIASVCRRVPASRRRESLTFGHHTEVAAQEPDRQDALLAEAEEQGWSVRALREAVSGTPEPRPEPEGLCPSCGAEAPWSDFRRK